MKIINPYLFAENQLLYHHHRSTTRLSSLRLHHHPLPQLQSFHNCHKPKKRLWSMCWSRNPTNSPILLFPLLHPHSPASPRYTSSATRPKRTNLDPIPTVLLQLLLAIMVLPRYHQLPRRPVLHMVYPHIK